jgi:hypothetical protein
LLEIKFNYCIEIDELKSIFVILRVSTWIFLYKVQAIANNNVIICHIKQTNLKIPIRKKINNLCMFLEIYQFKKKKKIVQNSME